MFSDVASRSNEKVIFHSRRKLSVFVPSDITWFCLSVNSAAISVYSCQFNGFDVNFDTMKVNSKKLFFCAADSCSLSDMYKIYNNTIQSSVIINKTQL